MQALVFDRYNELEWLADVYPVEAQKIHYERGRNGEIETQHIPIKHFPVDMGGEWLLLSPKNKITLPDGRQIFLSRFLQSEYVRDYILGYQLKADGQKIHNQLPDFAYYNTEDEQRRAKVQQLADELREFRKKYSDINGSFTLKEFEGFGLEKKWKCLFSKLRIDEALDLALGERSNFHHVINAASRLLLGLQKFIGQNNSVLAVSNHSIGRTQKDLIALFSDSIRGLPPMRIVNSQSGERALYVEAAHPDDVVYVGANPIPIQAGDTLREPGMLFGPTGGKLWHAGFDLSSATAVKHLSQLDDELKDGVIPRNELRSMEFRGRNQEVGPYGTQDLRMIDLLQGPITAGYTTLEELKHDKTTTHAAVIAVTKGSFTCGLKNVPNHTTLTEGGIYLIPSARTRGFSLLSRSPSRAIVMSSRLMCGIKAPL